MFSISSKINFFNPILLYHATFNDIPIELRGNVHNVRPENLYKQLSWLKKNHDFVFVDELLGGYSKSGKCAVTFDDAYLSVFEEALSVLKELEIPCTIFVNSSSFEGKTFWRDQVRYLLNSSLVQTFLTQHKCFCEENQITEKNFYGRTKHIDVNSQEVIVELEHFFANQNLQDTIKNFLINKKADLVSSPLVMFGNHTHNHCMLSSLEREEQDVQIGYCHQFLIENLPKKSVSKIFSIPFGGEHSITACAMNALRTNGYQAALMSRSRINVSYNMLKKTLHSFPIFERFMPVDDFKLFKKQFLGLKIRGLYNSLNRN